MKTYELIPLPDITPEVREIAVAWIEGYQPMGFDIQQKHKLASDIMNYAAGQVAAERERIKTEIYKVFGDSVVDNYSKQQLQIKVRELIDSL
jgi:hypothetical protein